MMLSYYNLPVIASSLDLILLIVGVMKGLRPEHYEISVKQVISEILNV